MGLYRWVHDWDRGWQLQGVWGDEWEQGHGGDFELDDAIVDAAFRASESTGDQSLYKEIKKKHPVPFTDELKNDLEAFHGS